jgi:hypothetical protein
MPEVAADPQGEVAKIFQNLGISVVQQCAKIRQQGTLSLHGSLEKNVPKTVRVKYYLSSCTYHQGYKCCCNCSKSKLNFNV